MFEHDYYDSDHKWANNFSPGDRVLLYQRNEIPEAVFDQCYVMREMLEHLGAEGMITDIRADAEATRDGYTRYYIEGSPWFFDARLIKASVPDEPLVAGDLEALLGLDAAND